MQTSLTWRDFTFGMQHIPAEQDPSQRLCLTGTFDLQPVLGSVKNSLYSIVRHVETTASSAVDTCASSVVVATMNHLSNRITFC